MVAVVAMVVVAMVVAAMVVAAMAAAVTVAVAAAMVVAVLVAEAAVAAWAVAWLLSIGHHSSYLCLRRISTTSTLLSLRVPKPKSKLGELALASS